MSRLGVFYALSDQEVEKLCALPTEERFDYMLEEIEENLLGTSYGCELDKAWEGIQYCLGGGQWIEENKVPTNIIFGGEFFVAINDEIISFKNHDEVEKIVAYLHENNLEEVIRKNFWNIDEKEFGYKNDDGLEHVLGWSKDICSFYENALKENLQVIFTVDL